jgi:hypothetical protein
MDIGNSKTVFCGNNQVYAQALERDDNPLIQKHKMEADGRVVCLQNLENPDAKTLAHCIAGSYEQAEKDEKKKFQDLMTSLQNTELDRKQRFQSTTQVLLGGPDRASTSTDRSSDSDVVVGGPGKDIVAGEKAVIVVPYKFLG